MTPEALQLSAGPLVGRVKDIEASTLSVDVFDFAMLRRVSVLDLVALAGRGPGERLLALVSGVTHDGRGARHDNGAGRDAPVVGTVRAMLIGTLDRAGDRDVFKRGAASFPSVGGECTLIEGDLLRQFMSIVAASVDPDERLELGRFVADENSVAVADGNRLFQRHAGLLGSTGTGKSWTVALMLERASKLAHPNLIVFDMHGEYAPLTEGRDGNPPIARGFRIAGPGDLSAHEDDVLFVPYWLLDRDEMLSLVLDETDPDAANQSIRFSDHVHKLKVSALLAEGYEETAATVTVDSPVPYRLENLVAWLKADDEDWRPAFATAGTGSCSTRRPSAASTTGSSRRRRPCWIRRTGRASR
jgi:uncharacterized protein